MGPEKELIESVLLSPHARFLGAEVGIGVTDLCSKRQESD